MYQLLAKKGQLFAILLGVVVLAISLGSIFSGLSSSGYDVSTDLNQVMKNNPGTDFAFFNPFMSLTFVLIAIALAAVVLFGIYQVITSPKSSLKGIIAVAALVGLFFLFTNMSSSDFDSPIKDTIMNPDFFIDSENTSKMISGGIKTTFLLAGAALVSMFAGEIINLFK